MHTWFILENVMLEIAMVAIQLLIDSTSRLRLAKLWTVAHCDARRKAFSNVAIRLIRS
jgi:hypothetical protein